MNKLIKETNADVNCFDKLKNGVKKRKLFYVPDMDQYYSANYQYKVYSKKIIKTKIKFLETFTIEVPRLNNNNMKRIIKNLVINHLILDFYFHYYIYRGINPIMQLTMLIYLLKCINIKKLTLSILIEKQQTYDLFCKLLKNILQKYCKDIRVVINYAYSSPDFITKLGSGIKILDETYATINKFKVNYHRNYQLKNRVD